MRSIPIVSADVDLRTGCVDDPWGRAVVFYDVWSRVCPSFADLGIGRTVRPRASLGSDRIPASIERQRNQGFQNPGNLGYQDCGPERCIQDSCLTFVIADSGPKKRYTAILSSGLIHLSDSFISAFGSGANLVFPLPNERQVYVHVGSEFVVSWSTVSRAK